MAERFAFHCACGASMTGRTDGPAGLKDAWDAFHSTKDCAPTDAKTAAAARRRDERALTRAGRVAQQAGGQT